MRPVCGSCNLNEPAFSFDIERREWVHHEPARIQMPSVVAADANGCRREIVRSELKIWCLYGQLADPNRLVPGMSANERRSSAEERQNGRTVSNPRCSKRSCRSGATCALASLRTRTHPGTRRWAALEKRRQAQAAGIGHRQLVSDFADSGWPDRRKRHKHLALSASGPAVRAAHGRSGAPGSSPRIPPDPTAAAKHRPLKA